MVVRVIFPQDGTRAGLGGMENVASLSLRVVGAIFYLSVKVSQITLSGAYFIGPNNLQCLSFLI